MKFFKQKKNKFLFKELVEKLLDQNSQLNSRRFGVCYLDKYDMVEEVLDCYKESTPLKPPPRSSSLAQKKIKDYPQWIPLDPKLPWHHSAVKNKQLWLKEWDQGRK